MLSAAALAKTKVDRLNKSFEHASAQVLLEHVIYFEFRGQIALVSSFGTEAAILLHMISQIDASFPIVFIDTGKLFTLTHKYRNELTDLFNLKNVITTKPNPADLEKFDPKGELWSRDVDACCHIRKVLPGDEALQGYAAQITGRKRSHGHERGHLSKFELDDGVIKINPLASWKRQHITQYFQRHEIPQHPLMERGYLSVGCFPCSAPADDPNDPRSGRWKGKKKTECGIHLPKDVRKQQ